MTAPQNNPRIKRGLLADRPIAGTVPEGTIYVYTDPALAGVIAVSSSVAWADTTAGALAAAAFGPLGDMASVSPTTNVVGTKTTASRVDHSHFHGNLPVEAVALHALATPAPGFDGFLSAADKLRLNQTQGGPGATVAGTALITPPRPFDPAGAINVTKFGLPGPTASVVLQIIATTPGVDFTVASLNAAGAIVPEAVLFFWSTTPV